MRSDSGKTSVQKSDTTNTPMEQPSSSRSEVFSAEKLYQTVERLRKEGRLPSVEQTLSVMDETRSKFYPKK